MHDAVTVHMSASPDQIWGLLSDVTRIGELSPETFEGEWVGDATGPAVGAKFRGHVRRNGRGPVYWTNCLVTECDPGRVFAFNVVGGGDRPMNSWRYDLEPSGEGTDVTESFRLPANPFTKIYWALAGRARGKTNREGMRATLERAKAIVEG
ncbi:MAG: SRPBCC family protein [Acidimicrobiales bacterium]